MHNGQLKGFFMGVGATAFAAIGLIGLTGFQATSPKMGVVDVTRVYNDSGLVKDQDEILRAADRARAAIFEYVKTYPTITREQATRFRELSVKSPKTDADTAELDKLKATIQAEEKKYRDLQTKASPSQEDLKTIEAYRTRAGETRTLLGGWVQEFQGELLEIRNQAQQQLMAKIRTAIADVGKREGYSVVYDVQFAPYAANDLTKQAQDAASKLK